jgi:hypothetical protein
MTFRASRPCSLPNLNWRRQMRRRVMIISISCKRVKGVFQNGIAVCRSHSVPHLNSRAREYNDSKRISDRWSASECCEVSNLRSTRNLAESGRLVIAKGFCSGEAISQIMRFQAFTVRVSFAATITSPAISDLRMTTQNSSEVLSPQWPSVLTSSEGPRPFFEALTRVHV